MATSYNNSTFKVFSDKMGGRQRSDYVGDAGEIFYDPNLPALWLSDGQTPGGIPILSSSTLDINSFYTKPQVDQLCLNLIGGATAAGNTLGKLELLIANNTTAINNISSSIELLVDLDQQVLAFNANTNILSISNGNSVDLSPLSSAVVPAYVSIIKEDLTDYPPIPIGTFQPLSLGSSFVNMVQGLTVDYTNKKINGLLAGSSYYISFCMAEYYMSTASGSAEMHILANDTSIASTTVYGLSGPQVSGATIATIYVPTANSNLSFAWSNSTPTITQQNYFITVHKLG